jgi:aminoglycoside phosphotransferase (APT) family kinase protein
VARSVGGDEVVRQRRLTGGIATATHLLTLRSGRQVVLRRHHVEWLEGGEVAGEVATLEHLRRFPELQAPELLAADVDGSSCGGRPAMLLARLPGRIELAPADPADWLRQLAGALALVHATPAPPATPGVGPSKPPPWLQRRDPPTWSAHPELWERASALVWDEPAPTPAAGGRDGRVLVHGDYQHFNLLWSRGRLTGIVDWSPLHDRPLDTDLGHCRLNLVILYGAEVADAFLRRYEEASGGRTVDPWWDLLETVMFLPTWAGTIRRQVGSRIPFDADAAHRRVDAHLPALLDRLGG